MFVEDIALGSSVFIPKDLSQDHLPMSLRFYDPVFQIIRDKLEDFTKEYFHLKNL